MRTVVFAIAAASAAALYAAPAAAGIPVEQRMRCPIGGGEFVNTSTASYSTFGARPDGKPYGSWVFPIALPECPDNGLVLYDQFDEAAVARLRPLVASAEYQALRRRGDSPYYRASWLMGRMQAPLPHQFWTLIQASWEVEGDQALRRRYLEELVARGPELGGPRDDDGLAIRAIVINAMRELGRFEEAAAAIAATRMEPARADPEARSSYSWPEHYRRLAAVIARRDSSVEPIDMIPRAQAQQRCTRGALDEGQRALCGQVEAASPPRRRE
jgi:hypothetical protein